MLKRLLIILLCLTWSIPATSDEINTILYKGDKAPYYGVLITEDNFRYYETLEIENESLSHLVATEQSTETPWKTLAAFAFGTLMGGLIVGARH